MPAQPYGHRDRRAESVNLRCERRTSPRCEAVVFRNTDNEFVNRSGRDDTEPSIG